MPSQYQLETMAGIDEEVAKHINKGVSPAAKTAISLLKMQVDCYEVGGMTLLKEAVKDCKREMSGETELPEVPGERI